VALVLASASSALEASLFALTSAPTYQLGAVGVFLAAMLAVFEPKRMRDARRRFGRRPGRFLRRLLRAGPSRLIAFAVLAPLAGLPQGRCYFHLPYLFCHACPRPCVFGVLRPYLVPAALLANLNNRTFCERVCPLGTAQVVCATLGSRRVQRLPTGWLLRGVALVLAVLAYLFIERGGGEGESGVWSLLFQDGFAPSLWMLGASAGLLILSFFVSRPFCEGLCPIGTVSGVVSRLEKAVPESRDPATGASTSETEVGRS